MMNYHTVFATLGGTLCCEALVLLKVSTAKHRPWQMFQLLSIVICNTLHCYALIFALIIKHLPL